ncbi:unnamed protein product [Brassica oleracea var. botrytis]|uniref:Uncharacterized protein n=1 Tax=Brassica oleracea TaxID=3712 RepID=A0A3P6EHJ0_BRAOL|nr:unnamed protein product [Brassica oleracea]
MGDGGVVNTCSSSVRSPTRVLVLLTGRHVHGESLVGFGCWVCGLGFLGRRVRFNVCLGFDP